MGAIRYRNTLISPSNSTLLIRWLMREKSSYPDNSCWCSGLLSRILQILTIFLLPQYLSADAWTSPREKRHNFTFAVRGGVATSACPRLHPLLQGPEGRSCGRRWGQVKGHILTLRYLVTQHSTCGKRPCWEDFWAGPSSWSSSRLSAQDPRAQPAGSHTEFSQAGSLQRHFTEQTTF